MLTALAMPCLNEEAILASNCARLGFGVGGMVDSDCYLVLVDNGSSDHTAEVIRHITRNSPPGKVIAVSESTRGYVPARRRANEAIRKLAKQSSVKSTDVLILQVDADTEFAPGYVSEMRNAAEQVGPNVLLEAYSKTPEDFARDHPGFQRLAAQTYMSARPLMCVDEDDVVVGDSVCGYRLSDYEAWGEHQREYTASGDEIFAETSRLYMRGKGKGASRCLVERASATLSRRRAFLEPLRFFASGGFPRERTWLPRWSLTATAQNLNAFERRDAEVLLREVCETRRRHLVALFGVLPALVARVLGVSQRGPSRAGIDHFLEQLANVPARMADDAPGRLIEAVLSIVDHPELFWELP